jgi:malonate-semialdehyde dehydrogenase (acetylating) / methylmalonate-semialdehyde dehydrogenase
MTQSSIPLGVNLIDGRYVPGEGRDTRNLYNPADASDLIAAVREASIEQVDQACAAARAFPGWRATPAPDRARVLYRFRQMLEAGFDDLARSIVRENGKLSEARGSLRRGIEVVEFACGIPQEHLQYAAIIMRQRS